jgi:hypothetical protein
MTAAQLSHAVILDNYQGGTAADKDVIGSEAVYGISSMDVSLFNNQLSVTINTAFSGQAGVLPGETFNGLGIGYGDLFLSSAWTPFGSAPYKTDDHSNGTIWTYGFSLDNRWSNAGAGTLYSLNSGNNDADALLTEDFMSVGAFRSGQEVAVDTSSNGVSAVNNGTWSTSAGEVNFLIDLTGTALENSKYIALHWGMTCANDIIEGQYEVPEPAILGLLAMGLIGVGISKRKKA